MLFPERVDIRAIHVWLVAAVLCALLLLPAYAQWSGQTYYITLVTRMMIYGIAATSLNLLVGYTGLVSLGHALFLGVGAYAVGITSFHGLDNGWLQLLLAVVGSAIVGALTGLEQDHGDDQQADQHVNGHDEVEQGGVTPLRRRSSRRTS